MTANSTYKLDDLTPHQLIDEVRQIAEQYSREVTTARRTWPKSIKDRVLALLRLGVPGARIGKECGIPVATVFFWYKQIPGRKRRTRAAAEPRRIPREARFLALAGPDTCNTNPTVGVELELEAPQMQPGAAPGFQVLLPGGIEVRGLASVEQVLALYRGCRA
jgi:hypothetical protein